MSRLRHGRLADLADRFRLDARLAFRTLSASPSLTLAGVTTLALGLGANAAVVATVDRLLFSDPPGIHFATHARRIQQHFTVAMTRERRTRDVFSFAELRRVAHPPA